MNTFTKISFFFFFFFMGFLCAFPQSLDNQSLYKRAIDGDTEAMHILGYNYKEENIIDSATFWLTKAAEKDYVYSQSLLGEILEEQETPNYEQALFWYLKAAKQGYNWAQYRVGHFYLHGLGTDADDKKAEVWLEKASKTGSCYGLPQYEYGKYYAKGIKAKEWLLKSSEEGFSEALTEIGRKYDSGFFEQNPDSAYYYYYSAAKKNNANGIFKLSVCYSNGECCKQSYKDALELYQIAEKLNSTDLLLYKTLNNSFNMNDAVEYDSIKSCFLYKDNASFYWYRDVAFNDNAESKYRLFSCYQNGIYGVKQDADEAAYWLGQAANSDILEAQVALGQLYEEEGNFQNAQYWYQRGYNCNGYMTTETSDDDFQVLKNKCKLALEKYK